MNESTEAAGPREAAGVARAGAAQPKPLYLVGVLAFALTLRVVQVVNAHSDPLNYQPGPDEDYYLRLGAAVAAGTNQYSAGFTFMDPGYGYLLGLIFKIAGVSVPAVYVVQAVLDSITACGLLVIGRLLGRPLAGLYGALLYAMTSMAIMFSATLLKEVWVASFVTWWVASALALIRSDSRLGWLSFGVLCGVGVALRSTLLLLALPALLLPGARFIRPHEASRPLVAAPARAATGMLMVACGLFLSLAPWALRNFHAYESLSPLPHNGGIVLQQIYNENNRSGAIWIPPFVNYFRPEEIWRGYAQEAAKREGHALSPPQVDAYWRGQAFDYIAQQPGRVAAAVLRKSLAFFSATEVPNNRSLTEERLFSPLLAWLPNPTPWLLALGLAGLLWFAVEDRRWPIIAAPIVVSWLMMAIFWPEERFRFYAAPVLALCGGLFIDTVVRRCRKPIPWQLPTFVAVACFVAAASLNLRSTDPAAAVEWDRAVWGYIKMGDIPRARELAQRATEAEPSNGAILEALGYLAGTSRQYTEAARYFERAIAVRPRSHIAHYNLAQAYMALGRRQEAAQEARTAVNLYPSPAYQALLNRLAPPR